MKAGTDAVLRNLVFHFVLVCVAFVNCKTPDDRQGPRS